MFFDKNREMINRYAKEVVEKVLSGQNPNDVIRRLWEENELSANMAQRIVEESNIELFLSKMSEGTHHEHYPLASPVIDECEAIIHIGIDTPMSEGGEAGMHKAASECFGYFEDGHALAGIEESMFNINDSSCESYSDMVISGDVDPYEDNGAELDKQASEDIYVDVFEQDELVKMAQYHIDMEANKAVQALSKLASTSIGLAKFAVANMAKEGLETYIDDLLSGTKFSLYDISNANIMDDTTPSEFEKVASQIVNEIKKSKELLKIKANKELKRRLLRRIGTWIKKNPGKSLVFPIAGYTLYRGIVGNDEEKVAADIAAFANQ